MNGEWAKMRGREREIMGNGNWKIEGKRKKKGRKKIRWGIWCMDDLDFQQSIHNHIINRGHTCIKDFFFFFWGGGEKYVLKTWLGQINWMKIHNLTPAWHLVYEDTRYPLSPKSYDQNCPKSLGLGQIGWINRFFGFLSTPNYLSQLCN